MGAGCLLGFQCLQVLREQARWWRSLASSCGDLSHLLPGARFPQGERADPYLLRRQWEHGIISRDSANCHAENLPGRDSRVLLDNIQLQATEQLEAGVTAGRDNIRILCIVVTDSSKHGNNLQAVRTTWGRRCTGFVAFSNRTDLELSAVETPAYGRVGDSNTWQKTRTMYKYILHRYLTEFDWFLRADDDTYIIWENLVHFLERKTIQDAQDSEEGLYMGRRFLLNGNKDDLYVSGGAGAVMDRAALRKLASHLDHPNCDPAGQHDFDDFFVGRCLAAAGVKPIDTRDERRRERFNPFQPWNHLRYKGGDWYQQYSPDGVQYGLDCCSQRSISFHFLPEKDMLATHRYLHDCRMAMTDI